MTWEEIWNAITDFFATSGLAILKGIGLFVIGYVVVKIIMLVLKKIFSRTKMEKVTQGFCLSIIKFVLYLILVIMVLQAFGVEITGIIAAMSAAGLAIGLALQNSLSNVASGIVLLITHPFSEGDYVSINNVEGKVKSIQILTTSLITYDNKIEILPNSVVANNPIINYSSRKIRRVEFTFKVDYNTDPALVKKVVTDVMKSEGKVQLKPEPFCSIKSFSENGLEFFAHCWCASEDYWDVFYYIWDNMFNEFNRNGIMLALPQVEVRMKKDKKEYPFHTEPLPKRANEKVVKLEEEETIESFFKKFDPSSEENQKRRKNAKEKSEKRKKLKLEKLELRKKQKQEKKKQTNQSQKDEKYDDVNLNLKELNLEELEKLNLKEEE